MKSISKIQPQSKNKSKNNVKNNGYWSKNSLKMYAQ